MRNRSIILILFAVLVLVLPGMAQQPYKLPPQNIIDIVDTPRTPSASISPSGRYMLLSENEAMVSIAVLGFEESRA